MYATTSTRTDSDILILVTTTKTMAASKSKSNQKLGFSENFVLSGIAAAVAKTSAGF